MRFHVITFGCQMNVNDSDWIGRSLRARGWEAAEPGQAEVFIVNTCSVREKPEKKVYSLVGRLARHHPEAFVAVGGCVAQQVGEGFFKRHPNVRLVFGADGTASVPGALERLAAEPKLRISLVDFTDRYVARDDAWPDEKLSGSAFVTIMQGCDNYCAYCIVPYVRGRQKSRPPGDVLAECTNLLSRGVRELTLVGQNVNSYGLDECGQGVGFAELLHRVAALPGLARLRFTTSHPKDIAPEVVRAFGELDNLAPHLHLPLQSGSDAVLARMGRKYDRARYLAIVADLRTARPDLALTTDLIVGFPGETEKDFQKTLEVMREANFADCFSFKYNDRPGVAAERFAPKIPEEVKAERLARLHEVQENLTRTWYDSLVGTKTEILFEGRSRIQKGALVNWSGREPSGRVVNVPVDDAHGDLTGRLARVTIKESKKNSLYANLSGEPW